LPVITTAHTAGPDLISEGGDGFIVPIRSAEAIAGKLDWLAGNSKILQEMKQAARKKAAGRRWADYRDSLVQMARDVIPNPVPISYAISP